MVVVLSALLGAPLSQVFVMVLRLHCDSTSTTLNQRIACGSKIYFIYFDGIILISFSLRPHN